MNQTRLESLVEGTISTVIGYSIAVMVQIIVLPAVGCEIPFSMNLLVGGVFTAVSIARGYLIRRFFNAGLHKLAAKIVNYD